jgi:FkbM family methyltransferase
MKQTELEGKVELTNELRHKIFEHLNSIVVIGAFDGVNYDDIYKFVAEKSDKTNTKALLVEPIPEYYKILTECAIYYGLQKHQVKTEMCCVGDVEMDVIMNYHDTTIMDKPWHIAGCSSVVENGEPLNVYLRNETPKENILEINSKMFTMAQILDRNGFETADYVQIDTEGYDQKIVKSFDIEKYNVKYLKFERYYCDPEFLNDKKIEMFNRGYNWFEDWDIHFIKKDLIKLVN